MNSYKKVSFASFNTILLIMMAVLLPLQSYGEDLGGSLIRDYPVALPISQGRIETSLDYLDLGELTDIYDAQQGYLERMQGVRMLFNYGLFKNTTLQSSFVFRNLDYGSSTAKISSLDISFKQMLTKRRYGKMPFVSLDIGTRLDYAGEMEYNSQTDINRIISKFSSGISIKTDDEYVWFEKQSNQVSEKVSKQGKPDLHINNQDMYDINPYLRLTTGKILGNFFPNIFFEYGSSYIRSSIDSSLDEYIPESFQGEIATFPDNLDRSEAYLKAGFCLLLKFPYRAMSHFEYNYIRLFRDDEYNQLVKNNHIVKADINFFITRRFIINIGGIYYHQQFNGIIPFINNEFTQTTFDDRYGRMHLGFTYLFK